MLNKYLLKEGRKERSHGAITIFVWVVRYDSHGSCVNGTLWSCVRTEAMSLEEEGRGTKRPIGCCCYCLVAQLCLTLLRPHRL